MGGFNHPNLGADLVTDLGRCLRAPIYMYIVFVYILRAPLDLSNNGSAPLDIIYGHTPELASKLFPPLFFVSFESCRQSGGGLSVTHSHL